MAFVGLLNGPVGEVALVALNVVFTGVIELFRP